MNIAIVCYPTFGGSGVVATELAKGLAEKGHHLHIVSYARPARLDHVQSSIVYHEVDLSTYPLFEFPPYDLALANMLATLIEYEKLDLIHVHYAIPHATSAYLAKQILGEKAAKVPVITTLHGTDITLVGSDPSYKKVVDFSINQSDGVTAVSEYLRKETYDRFDIRNEIEVIPNFVDLERFKPGGNAEFRKEFAPNGEFILSHVSNFREVKRVGNVVEVFARIRQEGVAAKLLMVGDGPERIKAQQRCRDLKICDHVSFLGKQDNVEELLAISDLFYIPSGSETFGLAALEAMSCGVPVISSNVGGLPEVNLEGVTGYLSELDDIEGMTQGSLRLLRDSEKLREFSANARARAEQFEKQQIVSQYEAYYENACAKLC